MDAHEQKPYLDLSQSINLESLLQGSTMEICNGEEFVNVNSPIGGHVQLNDGHHDLMVFEQDTTMDWPKRPNGTPVSHVEVTMVHGGSGGGGAIVLKHTDGRFLAAASGAGGSSGAMIERVRVDYPSLVFQDQSVKLIIQVGRGGRSGTNINVTIDHEGKLGDHSHQFMCSGQLGSLSRIIVTGCPQAPQLIGSYYAYHSKTILAHNGASIEEKTIAHGASVILYSGHARATTSSLKFESYGVCDVEQSQSGSKIAVNRAYVMKQMHASNSSMAYANQPSTQTTKTTLSSSCLDQKQPHMELSNMSDQLTWFSNLNTIRWIATDEHRSALSIDGLMGGHGSVAWMEQTDLSKPRPAIQQHPLMHRKPYTLPSIHKYTGYAMPVDDEYEVQCHPDLNLVKENVIDENPLDYDVAMAQLLEKCKKSCWTFGGAAGMGHVVHYPMLNKMVGQGGHGGYSPKPGVTVDPTCGNNGIVVLCVPKS